MATPPWRNGRRARLKIVWGDSCRFKSDRRHKAPDLSGAFALPNRKELNMGRGRETKRFPVAEILKPQGFKAQIKRGCVLLSSEIPTGGTKASVEAGALCYRTGRN